jgi:(S)-sulfolactate dehydrogenase
MLPRTPSAERLVAIDRPCRYHGPGEAVEPLAEGGRDMTTIVISEFMDEAAVAGLRDRHATLYDPTLVDRPNDLVLAVGEARALIVRNRTQVRGALLDAAVRLEVVGRLGVGLDNIDMAACGRRGIEVFPATGANDLAVAEYVITAAAMLLRGAYGACERMLAGEWPRSDLMGRELAGKTMGLVGLGSIARLVKEKALALGMTVAAHDPFVPNGDGAWDRVRQRPLDALHAEADVLSLHVPLTDGTRNLVDARAIAAMKPTAILINAARGGVVDEAALADALRAGRLGGAALDVFATEPLTKEAARVFAGVPNLILTPHIAGVTQESNSRVSSLIAEKVATALGD